MKEGERTVRVWRNFITGETEVLLSTSLPGHHSGEWMGAVGAVENGRIRWYDDAERRFERTGITKEQIIEDLEILAASQRRQTPMFPIPLLASVI